MARLVRTYDTSLPAITAFYRFDMSKEAVVSDQISQDIFNPWELSRVRLIVAAMSV